MKRLHFGLFGLFFLLASKNFGQNLPPEMRLDWSAHQLKTGDVETGGFYDLETIRTVEIWFAESNYWTILQNNYASKTDLAATMVIDGDTLHNVGVRFKGNTSYNGGPGGGGSTSQKKSFNVTLDAFVAGQKFMGYETFNFNNAFQDASFMREVAYGNLAKRHIPALKGNYVRLFLNGQSWGIYPNVQQVNGEFIKEWWFSNDGIRWRADVPPGSAGGGGGQWGDGTAALNWLGTDSTKYKKYYTLKASEPSEPWEKLIDVCDKLNNTAVADLDDTLPNYMDIDRTLWFLITEIAFSDDDSYVYKGKMDYYLYWDAETGRMTPIEFDGNSTFATNAVTWGPFYNETKVNYPLLNKLLKNPDVRQRYLAHWRTFLKTTFDQTTFDAYIDKIDGLINAEVQADPKKATTYNAYLTDRTALKNFVKNHRTNLLANAEVAQPAPTISDVKMTSPQGEWVAPKAGEAATVTAKLAFTTGIASARLFFSGAFTGNFSKTEMFDDGQHGDAAAGDGIFGATIPGFSNGKPVRFYIEAKAANPAGSVSFAPEGAEHDVFFYQVGSIWAAAPSVVINEVMAQNTAGEKDENGQHEDWIELFNTTSSTIDLANWTITDDAANFSKWTFPAGATIPANGYLILWADEDQMQGPLHTNFKLSAAGENVYFLNAQQQLVDTVFFQNQEANVAFARVPNGAGPFKKQAPTFAGNNDIVSTDFFETEPFEWAVFPTPATDAFFVVWTGQTPADRLEIIDFTGKTIQTESLKGQPNAVEINASSFSSGLYFLKCGAETKKLVVAR